MQIIMRLLEKKRAFRDEGKLRAYIYIYKENMYKNKDNIRNTYYAIYMIKILYLENIYKA
jgi:hypothetical protein